MHALLIIAHGSRKPSYAEEINLLVSRLEQQLTGYDFVEYAFLELSEPSIGNACDRLIEKGTRKISAFPYFLAAGRHILEDIPEEVNEVAQRHPEININLMNYFGSTENNFNALCQELEVQDQ